MDPMNTLLGSLALPTRNADAPRESEDAWYARNAGPRHTLRNLFRRTPK